MTRLERSIREVSDLRDFYIRLKASRIKRKPGNSKKQRARAGKTLKSKVLDAFK